MCGWTTFVWSAALPVSYNSMDPMTPLLPSERLVSDGPPEVKTTPAASSACRMRVRPPGPGILGHVLKLTDCVFAQVALGTTQDQFNSVRTARDCSAVSFRKS